MALAPKYREFHSMTASIWNFNNLSKIFTASEQLFTPVSSCRIGRAHNGNVSFYSKKMIPENQRVDIVAHSQLICPSSALLMLDPCSKTAH